MSDELQTSELEAFLKQLAHVAATGGDVRACVADTAVCKPSNITAVIAGDGSGVIWSRNHSHHEQLTDAPPL